jgi:hypothetical protein
MPVRFCTYRAAPDSGAKTHSGHLSLTARAALYASDRPLAERDFLSDGPAETLARQAVAGNPARRPKRASRPAACAHQCKSLQCGTGRFALQNGHGVVFSSMSAAFSPIMIDGALVLPDVSVGMIEASAIRRPLMP